MNELSCALNVFHSTFDGRNQKIYDCMSSFLSLSLSLYTSSNEATLVIFEQSFETRDGSTYRWCGVSKVFERYLRSLSTFLSIVENKSRVQYSSV
jgi:hypothetical protein